MGVGGFFFFFSRFFSGVMILRFGVSGGNFVVYERGCGKSDRRSGRTFRLFPRTRDGWCSVFSARFYARGMVGTSRRVAIVRQVSRIW